MSAQPLLLIAASGLAREVLSVLGTSIDRRVVGFIDDDVALHGTAVDGIPVLGGLSAVAGHPEAKLVVCAGSGGARSTIVARLSEMGVDDTRYAQVIDWRVQIPESCTVGVGTILLANTVLTSDVTLGAHVVAMPNVVFTHDDSVADFATAMRGRHPWRACQNRRQGIPRYERVRPARDSYRQGRNAGHGIGVVGRRA